MIKPKITQKNAAEPAESNETALSALNPLTEQQRQMALHRYRQIAPFYSGIHLSAGTVSGKQNSLENGQNLGTPLSTAGVICFGEKTQKR